MLTAMLYCGNIMVNNMNKRINVYDDGKLGRATHAEIVEVDEINDRYLIRFTVWDDEQTELWFYRDNIEETDINNAVYTCYDENSHWDTNFWYFPNRETYDFALECSEWFTPEYWNEHFSHLLSEEKYETV